MSQFIYNHHYTLSGRVFAIEPEIKTQRKKSMLFLIDQSIWSLFAQRPKKIQLSHVKAFGTFYEEKGKTMIVSSSKGTSGREGKFMCVKKFGNIDKETQLDVFDRVALKKDCHHFLLLQMDIYFLNLIPVQILKKKCQ